MVLEKEMTWFDRFCSEIAEITANLPKNMPFKERKKYYNKHQEDIEDVHIYINVGEKRKKLI